MGERKKVISTAKIQSDFVEGRLTTLCVPEDGVQTGPFGSLLHHEDYVSIGTPIITVEHLGENRIQHQDLPRVSDEDRNRLSKYQLHQGDIVFSRVGSVDRRALVRKEEEGWLFSGRCLRVRPDNSKIDSTYLSYFFGLQSFKEHIRAIAVGATMPSLNTQILSDVTILYPKNLDTQRAIATILGALDDKIELNRRMNETLEAMAQALFKSWFVDAVQDGLPEGWRSDRLDNIATYLNGLALQKFPPDRNDSLPVIKIAQIRTGDTAGSDRASAHLDPAYVVEDGDILFSWSGSLEVVIWCGGRGALNQHLFKVTSTNYPKWFYYLWTKYHLPTFRAIAADKATTMGHIQRGHLSQAEVLIPNSDAMKTMNAQMAPIIERIIVNNVESRTLAAIRDALLPKLLSGEVPVNEAIRETAARG